MLICWDLAFPEAFRELIAGGAKMIIIPTFWNLSDCTEAGLKANPKSEALFLESTIVSRCFENTVSVVREVDSYFGRFQEIRHVCTRITWIIPCPLEFRKEIKC
jgi:hypothetical protein